MSPQNLCNVVWAAVVLEEAAHMPVSTWEEIAKRCMLKMPEMPIQSVSNLMWAYAKMGLRWAAGLLVPMVKALHTTASMYGKTYKQASLSGHTHCGQLHLTI